MATPTAQQLVDAIDAAILGTIEGEAAAYTIAGRSVTKLSIRELTVARQHFATLAARQSGGGFSLAARGRVR